MHAALVLLDGAPAGRRGEQHAASYNLRRLLSGQPKMGPCCEDLSRTLFACSLLPGHRIRACTTRGPRQPQQQPSVHFGQGFSTARQGGTTGTKSQASQKLGTRMTCAVLSQQPQPQPHVHLGQGLVLARIQFRFSLSALFLI